MEETIEIAPAPVIDPTVSKAQAAVAEPKKTGKVSSDVAAAETNEPNANKSSAAVAPEIVLSAQAGGEQLAEENPTAIQDAKTPEATQLTQQEVVAEKAPVLQTDALEINPPPAQLSPPLTKEPSLGDTMPSPKDTKPTLEQEANATPTAAMNGPEKNTAHTAFVLNESLALGASATAAGIVSSIGDNELALLKEKNPELVHSTQTAFNQAQEKQADPIVKKEDSTEYAEQTNRLVASVSTGAPVTGLAAGNTAAAEPVIAKEALAQNLPEPSRLQFASASVDMPSAPLAAGGVVRNAGASLGVV